MQTSDSSSPASQNSALLEEALNLAFQHLVLPDAHSHKGQNGKVLIIGGSQLFHAASKWSLDIASKFVDMVFYSSVPSNNHLIEQVKGRFWNGIVIPREEISSYIEEADSILVGPGMTRTSDTEEITSTLVRNYPNKRWVIDAGALQMIDPDSLTPNCILTPHRKELTYLEQKGAPLEGLVSRGITVLMKGQQDTLYASPERWQNMGFKSNIQGETNTPLTISGGNPGMTKGGTGDVLAGLLAALYAKSDALSATLIASYANKRAGELLAKQVGPFFNASDLVDQVPQVIWAEYQQRQLHSA